MLVFSYYPSYIAYDKTDGKLSIKHWLFEVIKNGDSNLRCNYHLIDNEKA